MHVSLLEKVKNPVCTVVIYRFLNIIAHTKNAIIVYEEVLNSGF